VDAVGAPGAEARLELLQLGLDQGEHVGVQQLPELGISQQLPELRLVDGQGLRPTLGERCIAVVDVVGDEAEEQR